MITKSIHEAIKVGDSEYVEAAISGNRDLVASRNDSGWQPLHVAALHGQDSIARLLLSEGADVNAKDGDGCTPLHEAASKGHKSMVELLLTAGAIPSMRSGGGDTPLDYAKDGRHQDVVALLSAHLTSTRERSAAGWRNWFAVFYSAVFLALGLADHTNDQIVVLLFFAATIFQGLVANVAVRKGYNYWLWYFSGSIMGAIYLSILPYVNQGELTPEDEKRRKYGNSLVVITAVITIIIEGIALTGAVNDIFHFNS